MFVTWLSTIAIMYQSIRTLESKFVDLYPWKRIISIILLSLLSGIPVFALTTVNISHLVLLIVGSLVYGIIFLYSTFKLDLWGETEINLFNSFWSLKNR